MSRGGEILRCAQDDNGGQEADLGLGGGVTMEGQQADPWVRGGDIVRQLGLMCIRADKLVVGAVNWSVRVMQAFLRLQVLMNDPGWILSVY